MSSVHKRTEQWSTALSKDFGFQEKICRSFLPQTRAAQCIAKIIVIAILDDAISESQEATSFCLNLVERTVLKLFDKNTAMSSSQYSKQLLNITILSYRAAESKTNSYIKSLKARLRLISDVVTADYNMYDQRQWQKL